MLRRGPTCSAQTSTVLESPALARHRSPPCAPPCYSPPTHRVFRCTSRLAPSCPGTASAPNHAVLLRPTGFEFGKPRIDSAGTHLLACGGLLPTSVLHSHLPDMHAWTPSSSAPRSAAVAPSGAPLGHACRRGDCTLFTWASVARLAKIHKSRKQLVPKMLSKGRHAMDVARCGSLTHPDADFFAGAASEVGVPAETCERLPNTSDCSCPPTISAPQHKRRALKTAL